jgi:hypothetical protein
VKRQGGVILLSCCKLVWHSRGSAVALYCGDVLCKWLTSGGRDGLQLYLTHYVLRCCALETALFRQKGTASAVVDTILDTLLQTLLAVHWCRRAEACRSDLTSRTFVAAAITEWPAGSSFPYVNVRTSLGPTGDIEAGTAALLAGEGIHEQDFSLEVSWSGHCTVTT